MALLWLRQERERDVLVFLLPHLFPLNFDCLAPWFFPSRGMMYIED